MSYPPGYPPPQGFPPPPGHGGNYGAPQPYPPAGGYSPPPGFPPPPLPPPGYPYPPRRSGGAGPVLLAVFGALLAVVVVAGLVVFAAGRSSTGTSASPTFSTPSFSYPPTTAGPVATSVAAPPTAAARTSRVSRTTTATTSAAPAGPQQVAATTDNPLFADADYGLQNIQCGYPQWGSDQASAQAFFEAARSCLDQMWQPLLHAVGLPFSTPNIAVPVHAADQPSPCTGSTSNYAAFYCSANSTIYMPLDKIQIDLYGNDAVIYLAVFAHEYGHHVQALSGIMAKESRDRYNAGQSSPVGAELSRRLELEAQCFGGMFVGSSQAAGTITAQQGQHTINDSYTRGDRPGDVRDHGTTDHYGGWWAQGYQKNRTQPCNTWLAASGDVS
ncbi:neutral zinc metallopeptidase [Nocardia sp. alder85J]|uniref:neutral zinc metallopeptidase n=1 Tax=Nocardia sp. alder85J TaxID=2862949 RepID=UPI001CD2680F|nr:neutral zinc metallopeptidase [Nocardia sp. alder85J]MCX4093748.1 neutral zinc metallopeptidase [Nocardia sp. alder85J]